MKFIPASLLAAALALVAPSAATAQFVSYPLSNTPVAASEAEYQALLRDQRKSAQARMNGFYLMPPATVVISEVCYLPAGGEPDWIELCNLSAEPVNLQGWRLYNGETLDLEIAAGEFVKPGSGFLVVIFDGQDKIEPFDRDLKATIHSPNDLSGNVLGNRGGQVALFSPPPNPPPLPEDESVIRSYVAWGLSPGRILQMAVAAGEWSHERNGVVAGTGPELSYGFSGRISQPGGSLGLNVKEHTGRDPRDWVPFMPGEVNPGVTGVGKAGALLTYPPRDMKFMNDTGKTALYMLQSNAPGVKYEFQVSTDTLCAKIIMGAISDHSGFVMQEGIPRKTTYYWRGRLVHPDGSFSAWSEIRSITRG